MKPPIRSHKPLLDPLENRLLCRLSANGEFVITPPGGGQAYETIKLQPTEGAVGLRAADANSNGVVNWQKTGEHEWSPGDQSGPHQFA